MREIERPRPQEPGGWPVTPGGTGSYPVPAENSGGAGLTSGPPVVFSLDSRRINGHTDEECE